MAEALLGLKEGERREALLVAAERTGRPAYLLEKDVWVVWTLGALFGEPTRGASGFQGRHLVVQGLWRLDPALLRRH